MVWRVEGGGGGGGGGGGVAKLRNVKKAGETLGVVLICRKSCRQGSNMDLSGSLFVFGNGGTPVVLASIRANKKAKVLTMMSNVHIPPLRDVNFEPTSHSQIVLLGAGSRG